MKDIISILKIKIYPEVTENYDVNALTELCTEKCEGKDHFYGKVGGGSKPETLRR